MTKTELKEDCKDLINKIDESMKLSKECIELTDEIIDLANKAENKMNENIDLLEKTLKFLKEDSIFTTDKMKNVDTSKLHGYGFSTFIIDELPID